MLTPNQRRRNSLGQDCSTILSYPQRRDSVWTPQGIAVQNLRGNLHPPDRGLQFLFLKHQQMQVAVPRPCR
jgi:hypothetical protein